MPLRLLHAVAMGNMSYNRRARQLLVALERAAFQQRGGLGDERTQCGGAGVTIRRTLAPPLGWSGHRPA